MKPHKHCELIKAWADGAEIQHRYFMGANIQEWSEWEDKDEPIWNTSEWDEYRIKPEPKPDVVWYATAYLDQFKYQKVPQLTAISQKENNLDNLKLTFDGETGELKSAEVLK